MGVMKMQGSKGNRPASEPVREKAGNRRLTVEESDRAARIARVMALAERTFANQGKAHRWLHRSLASLDDRRPIDLLQTTTGTRLLEDLLAKISWGVAA